MKNILPVCIVGLLIIVIVAVGAGSGGSSQKNTLLRVHIRANSNAECDQNVKYIIKDEIVDYLTPYLANATTFEKAKSIINSHLPNIEQICDKILAQKGFTYRSHAKINNEYFPTRAYKDYVVDSGYYDALIVELGSASGNNWWCVVYPPLCFTGEEGKNNANVVYKSRIMEIIRQFYNSEGE